MNRFDVELGKNASVHEVRWVNASKSTDTHEGRLIRFKPVEIVFEISTVGHFSGSHGIVYRTITGRFVVVLTNWFDTDIIPDERRAKCADTLQQIYHYCCEQWRLDDNEAARLLAKVVRRDKLVA